MTEDSTLSGPIESLQLMLRTLSMLDEELPTLVPDGIYGSATANAVSAFQKKHDLPITGIADRDTHQAIVDAYDRAVPYLSIAEGPVVLFPAKLVISPGQSHPHVYLIQAMMTALHQIYPEIQPLSPTGRVDSPTESGLRMIQSLNHSDVSGALDKSTYNDVSRLYRSTFDRSLPPANG